MTAQRKQLIAIACLVVAIFVVDQITKLIIMRTIEAESISVYENLDKFFWITHERNPGLVGGMFRDVPGMAIILSTIACGVLIYLYFFLDKASKLQTFAYGILAGGAAGNMIDRFLHQSVTDFLQFNFYFIPFDFPWKLWPAFNVADICITSGVFILIVSWNLSGEPSKDHVADSS